jgi:hypothetical protein
MKKNPEVRLHSFFKAVGTPMTTNEVDSTKGVVVSLTSEIKDLKALSFTLN